ncbi:MAG: c-type cytochrome [Minwuia sp.]|uniref:c-type cytochrome n=1 Tax=Minwuia sp. TaxID=2493630 RepID=UPI003A8C04D7
MPRVAALMAGIVLAAIAAPGASSAAGDKDTGNQLYHTYCSVCHGPRMMNSGARAADLRKMTPGMTARFRKAVLEGKSGPKGEMPSWADILSAQEVEDIWAYVKTKGK